MYKTSNNTRSRGTAWLILLALLLSLLPLGLQPTSAWELPLYFPEMFVDAKVSPAERYTPLTVMIEDEDIKLITMSQTLNVDDATAYVVYQVKGYGPADGTACTFEFTGADGIDCTKITVFLVNQWNEVHSLGSATNSWVADVWATANKFSFGNIYGQPNAIASTTGFTQIVLVYSGESGLPEPSTTPTPTSTQTDDDEFKLPRYVCEMLDFEHSYDEWEQDQANKDLWAVKAITNNSAEAKEYRAAPESGFTKNLYGDCKDPVGAPAEYRQPFNIDRLVTAPDLLGFKAKDIEKNFTMVCVVRCARTDWYLNTVATLPQQPETLWAGNESTFKFAEGIDVTQIVVTVRHDPNGSMKEGNPGTDNDIPLVRNKATRTITMSNTQPKRPGLTGTVKNAAGQYPGLGADGINPIDSSTNPATGNPWTASGVFFCFAYTGEITDEMRKTWTYRDDPNMLIFAEPVTPTPSLTPEPSIPPSIPPSIEPSIPPSLPPSIAPSLPPSIAPSIPPSIAPSLPPSAPPPNQLTDPGTGIVVESEPGVLPEGTTLSVEPAPDGSTGFVLAQSAFGMAKFEVFDINLMLGDVTIQPGKGKNITIKIPVPAGYTAQFCTIYRVEANGDLTKMQLKVEDGYFVFTTDHLSFYAFAQPPKGDINGDFNVNITDILMVRDIIFGIKDTDEYMLWAAGVPTRSDVTINVILVMRNIIFGIV